MSFAMMWDSLPRWSFQDRFENWQALPLPILCWTATSTWLIRNSRDIHQAPVMCRAGCQVEGSGRGLKPSVGPQRAPSQEESGTLIWTCTAYYTPSFCARQQLQSFNRAEALLHIKLDELQSPHAEMEKGFIIAGMK